MLLYGGVLGLLAFIASAIGVIIEGNRFKEISSDTGCYNTKTGDYAGMANMQVFASTCLPVAPQNISMVDVWYKCACTNATPKRNATASCTYYSGLDDCSLIMTDVTHWLTGSFALVVLLNVTSFIYALVSLGYIFMCDYTKLF